jgi:dihydroflavonol-4-reductase
MKALVTGANGHIGSHVVRAAIEAGMIPVAFVRPKADRRSIADLDVEVREGDLLDAEAVQRAVSGVDIVFHVGAAHRNFARDPGDIVRPAVEGTRNVLAGVRAAGVKRFVYTSTGATMGFAADPKRALSEDDFLETAESPYIRGKIEAEKLVREAAERGEIDAVIVNPSGTFGPRDYRLTPATRAILGLLQGDPAFFHVSVTDVRDVARCHVLAATKGRTGRRYLATGAVCAPADTRALFDRLAGVRPPAFTPPRFILSFMAGRMEKKAIASGGDAPLTRAIVRDFFGKHLAYDSTRARTELGATFRGADDVIRDTVRWLLFVDAVKPKVAARARAVLGDVAAPDADWRN